MASTLTTSLRHRARRVLGAANRVARSVEIFDRPRWLYRSRGAIPKGELYFREPIPVSDADLRLSARLIDAFALAQDAGPEREGIWSHEVFQERQRELAQALHQREPDILAGLLASMFRSDFVLGLHSGSLGTGPQSQLSRRFAWLSALSKLVALAESEACVPVENPEHGRVGLAFTDGDVETLIERLEAALGVSLDFPEVGAAYGVSAAGRMITYDTADQVYAARRLLTAMDTHLASGEVPPRIVEIGGGYGAMAYWLLQMRDLPYVVVDLPIINVLQGYFLAQTLGHERVSLYGENPAQITITPNHALSEIQTPIAVLANKDSMPEIPRSALLTYLTWARAACEGLLYSYNHEGAEPFDGTPQNIVPEIVAQVGGFRRIRRDPSWLRRGYVEEIYVPARSGAGTSRSTSPSGH